MLVFASVIFSQSVDLTLEEGAISKDVVRASISKIENAAIFPSDRRLLFRIAFVETELGENPPSAGDHGGIWNVDEEDFDSIITNDSLAIILQNISVAFRSDFLALGLTDWASVQWVDLDIPLLSALAARLLIHSIELNVGVSIPTSSDIDGQATFWMMYYNTDGDAVQFREDIELLEEGIVILLSVQHYN